MSQLKICHTSVNSNILTTQNPGPSAFVLLERISPYTINWVSVTTSRFICIKTIDTITLLLLPALLAWQKKESKKGYKRTRISWYIIFIDKIHKWNECVAMRKMANEIKFPHEYVGHTLVTTLEISHPVILTNDKKNPFDWWYSHKQTKVSDVHSLWSSLSSTTAWTAPTSTTSTTPASASSTSTSSCSSYNTKTEITISCTNSQ